MKRVLAVLAVVAMLAGSFAPLGAEDWGTPIPEETAQPCVYPDDKPEECDLSPVPVPFWPSEEIQQLPNTGAGTSAPVIKVANHTGWHYVQWCDSGWILWYRYYATVWNHNIHYSESFGNLGRCWF